MNFSLGSGITGGLGLFVDRGRKDDYRVVAGVPLALGCAATNVGGDPIDLGQWPRSLGLFLDLGGADDAYDRPGAANGTAWTQTDPTVPAGSDARGAIGAGLDR